jgi:hypothetical protein
MSENAGPSRFVTAVGWASLAALPFDLRLAYEAIILRQRHGPQMLLFSLVHGALPSLLTVPVVIGMLAFLFLLFLVPLMAVLELALRPPSYRVTIVPLLAVTAGAWTSSWLAGELQATQGLWASDLAEWGMIVGMCIQLGGGVQLLRLRYRESSGA